MYFYKEVRKREVALTSQLAKWCMDDYNCFIQKYLLGDDYFDCLIYRSQIYIDDNKRPCLENRAVINTENLIEKRLFIFVKTEGSFLFDDEKIDSNLNGKDLISKIKEGEKKALQSWFIWVIPKNFCPYKNELKNYVDSCNTETTHAKIVFWEDLLDEYGKSRKNCAAEKEIKLVYKMLNQRAPSIKDYYPAEIQLDEILITSNDFNTAYCEEYRDINTQALIELNMNSDEDNLDSSVETILNKRADEIKKAENVLLVLDDDREGKALKESIIKYFKKNFPSIVMKAQLECITFPKYFIEPNNTFPDGIVVESFRELEEKLEEWNEDSPENQKDDYPDGVDLKEIQELKRCIEYLQGDSYSKSFIVKREIKTLEEMGKYAEYYLYHVCDDHEHREIVK